jgi:hypothetical protein
MSKYHLTPPDDSRAITGAPGYRVRDGGEIWSCHTTGGIKPGCWHILKPRKPNRSGHLQIELRIDGKPIVFYVHHLVLEAFVGPRPTGLLCCHHDGNPLNNFAVNLRWDTQKSNVADCERHGRKAQGDKSGVSKLKECDIRRIFELAKQGLTQDKIGAVFGVSKRTISLVLRREIWVHVEIPDDLRVQCGAAFGVHQGMSKLKDSDIVEIFSLSRNGVGRGEIAKRFCVSRSNIDNILTRKTWTHVPV